MRKQLAGLVRLTRFKEYPFFVMITTLIGAAAARGEFGWKLVGVLAANLLAVAFAFMINDVEDANDDALDPVKRQRNPVSARDVSPRTGRLAAFVVAVISLTIYTRLGLWTMIAGASALLIAYLYSWRQIRLKTMPLVDLLSHGMMLAGLQFLAAYFTFEGTPLLRWVVPFSFMVAISLYGELFNELRDLEVDREAGLNHTACFLGQRTAFWLMMVMLLTGVSSGLVTIFIVRLFANWVLIALAVFTALLIIPSLLKVRRHRTHLALQESFQKPVEIAAAFALVLQFVAPWAAHFFS